MREPLPISSLEIVGYANRLSDDLLPAIVPPIFRDRNAPDRLLLPPFIMQTGFVCGAQEVTAGEMARLQDAGEITLLETTRPAHRDYELWIASDWEVHYEPIPEAAQKLLAIAKSSISQAVTALGAGDLTLAIQECRKASCADDRLIEPFALRAAIARQQNDGATERLMARIVEKRCTSEAFEALVKNYSAGLGRVDSEITAKPIATSAMCGIALVPAS